MAVALSNGIAGSSANGSSRTFSYTVNSNSNRALLAQVFSTTATITAITYAGVPLTLLDSHTSLSLYGLTNPASGANNISYTLNMYETSAVTLANFDGVDQTSPFGSVTRNTGSSAAPQSTSLTVPVNGMLYAAGRHSYSGGAASAGSGTTLAGVESSSGASRFGGYRTTTGVVAFSTPSSNTWALQTVPINAAGGADTTPPVLSSPTGTQTGSSSGTGGATTNEANGTIYSVASTSATPPSALQVEAGQSHTGSAAAAAANAAVSSTGAKSLNFTGLNPSTVYYAHTMHKDAAGNRSNVVTSASFTTAALTGSFTSGQLAVAGALQLSVSVKYTLFVGASAADFGNKLAFVAETGTGTTHASAGTLTKSGHTLGPGWLEISDLTGNCLAMMPVVVA